MGGREENPDPALQSFVTGVLSHLRREERRSFRRASLRFFFLSVSLPFDGACRILKADSKVFSHHTKELRYRC